MDDSEEPRPVTPEEFQAWCDEKADELVSGLLGLVEIVKQERERVKTAGSEARGLLLKKVVLAMGNTLIYADTYAQALAQLGGVTVEAPATQAPVTITTTAPGKAAANGGDPRIAEIRRHLEWYQELVGHGKWSDARKELEAIRGLVGK